MTESVFTREDTLFGVCFALAADFGFSPTWPRILFALLFFWSPPAAAAAYAGVGIVVAFSRWLVPEPGEPTPDAEPVAVDARAVQDEAQEELPLAA